MGDHDHQPVLGNLLQKIHNLHTGFRVQSAGGFVGQQNIRVIHQGTGNGHSLHLTAGHLIGLFMKLIAQANGFQGNLGPLFALRGRNAGDGQCQLHIGKDALMGNQIIALEHEADGVVAVGIPVPVIVFLGGNAVDDQITAVVTVQTADDIEQRGLAGAGGAQDGNKLIVPQVQTHSVQGCLHQISRNILFSDVLDLQHMISSLPKNGCEQQLSCSVSCIYEQINNCIKESEII